MRREWENSQVLDDAVKAVVNGDEDRFERVEAAKHAYAVAYLTTPWVAQWLEIPVFSLVCAIKCRRLALPMKPLWPEGPMTGFWILLAADDLVDIFSRTVEHSLSCSARELHCMPWCGHSRLVAASLTSCQP